MDFLEKSTMNLKEGFRYQNFLNTLMAEAETYLFSDDHLFKTTKKHMRRTRKTI